jgi:hypothetical protein
MAKWILLTLFATITLQDLKYRAVYWMFFPMVFVVSSWQNYNAELLFNCLMSLLFILFLLSSLTIYLSLRQKQFIRVWNGFFSWGDILFILAITPLFSWNHFIYFFTFGTIGVLLIFAITVAFVKNKTIPYAGYLALIASSYIIYPNGFNQLFTVLSGN